MYPSSSGVKVYEMTSSISSTTVILLGSVGGGSSLGLLIFFLSMAWARCALLVGYFWTAWLADASAVFFLEKKVEATECRSLFLFMCD